MTSMIHISNPSETTKLIKKRKVIPTMIGEYVFSLSIPGVYEKACATNRVLSYNLIIFIAF